MSTIFLSTNPVFETQFCCLHCPLWFCCHSTAGIPVKQPMTLILQMLFLSFPLLQMLLQKLLVWPLTLSVDWLQSATLHCYQHHLCHCHSYCYHQCCSQHAPARTAYFVNPSSHTTSSTTVALQHHCHHCQCFWQQPYQCCLVLSLVTLMSPLLLLLVHNYVVLYRRWEVSSTIPMPTPDLRLTHSTMKWILLVGPILSEMLIHSKKCKICKSNQGYSRSNSSQYVLLCMQQLTTLC